MHPQVPPSGSGINPKSEARSPKQIRISNAPRLQTPHQGAGLGHFCLRALNLFRASGASCKTPAQPQRTQRTHRNRLFCSSLRSLHCNSRDCSQAARKPNGRSADRKIRDRKMKKNPIFLSLIFLSVLPAPLRLCRAVFFVVGSAISSRASDFGFGGPVPGGTVQIRPR